MTSISKKKPTPKKTTAEIVREKANAELALKQKELTAKLERAIEDRDVNSFVWLLAEISGHFAIHGARSPLSASLEVEMLRTLKESSIVIDSANPLSEVIMSDNFQKLIEERKKGVK
jgi:hypothetical protein